MVLCVKFGVRMKTLPTLTMFAALLVGVATVSAHAADVTEAELMQAAIELGRQYDANYADKNPDASVAYV